MLTLLTTSWTIWCSTEPDYLKTGEYFENLIAEFFELEYVKHKDYPNENIYVFSITYPAYQAKEFAMRIMEFCVYNQKQLC